jgi:hypothetical protein
MTAPANAVQVQGQGAVSADFLNTLIQGCASFAAAGSFPGTVGMAIYVWGFTTPGDGGQGIFLWNATAGPSDNLNVIQPSGVAQGAWVRDGTPPGVLTAAYSLQVPVTGFNIQIPNGVSSLILNPAGVLATGTIQLPTKPVDQQIVTINSMQTVTSVSWGATFPTIIIGAPATLLQSGPGTSFQYVATQGENAWFRYG